MASFSTAHCYDENEKLCYNVFHNCKLLVRMQLDKGVDVNYKHEHLIIFTSSFYSKTTALHCAVGASWSMIGYC